MNTNKTVTRREFLKIAGMTAGAATLAACTPGVVTQIVQQTVVSTVIAPQTQIVQQTSIVQVTPTPLPAIVTPQGRTLPADAAPLAKQIQYGAAPGERKNFDYARDIYYAYGMNSLSEPLVRNDYDFNTVPGLAESWKAGPNTTYWEFVIRQGAVWSDGQPITTDDVVFTWAHAANPAMANSLIGFYAPIKGVSEVFAGGAATLITDPKTGGVRKVDDRTVRFYGEGPSADGDPCPFMLGLLSYQAACTIPKHMAEKDELHWADNLPQISGGPWLYTDWKHNVSMTLDINPTYNGPQKAGIQHQEQYIPAANDNAMATFLAQKIDLMGSLDATGLAIVRSNPKLNQFLHFYANFESQYLSLNTFVKPLDNQKLRMALAKSFDRVILCSSVLNGTYAAGYTMLPPSFPAYNKALESVQSLDLTAAQQLLSDAGYPKGKDAAGTQLVIEITSQGGADVPRAAFLQQQWQDNLGIKVNIKTVDGGTWGKLRGSHGMPIFFGQYEYDFIDPSNLLTGLFHSDPTTAKANKTPVEKWGSPRHPWYSVDYDKLCDQAGIEADIAKRISEYQAAETIQVNDAGQIFYSHQVIYQVWWPWVLGIRADKNGNVVFRPFDLSAYDMYISKDVDALKAQYKGIA